MARVLTANLRFLSRICSYSPIRCKSVFFRDGVPPPQLAFVTPEWEKLYQQSLNNPIDFWGRLGSSRLQWMEEFHTVMDCDIKVGQHRWFLGGKINVAENCIDRHLHDPDRVALIWEQDEPGHEQRVTYKELSQMTNQIANALKRRGVCKGQRVCLYMPVSPLAVASMLACARIGAVHSVVFAGFSAEALSQRIRDAEAETVITADQGIRGGKIIELKQTVDEAVKKSPSVKQVFVMARTGANVPMGKVDIPLEEAMSKESVDCDAEPMDSEDTLFLLYTSGSTGNPKGIVHSQAGYLLYAGLTQQYVFDYQPGDIFGCVADIGWVTGHTYGVYGPLSNGGTSVLFESIPTYPDPGRYWEMVQRLKINQFYGAPTAIRLLLKYGDSHVLKYDRSSLKLLGTVGEPINEEAWLWYHDVVGEGRCPVVDTWWQTETGGIFIAPRPSPDHRAQKPRYAMRPFFGVQPVLVDEKNHELYGNDVSGALCIKRSVPGMARTVYGDPDRFISTYYAPIPGYYFTGDGAYRDKDGDYEITGRMDDVINVSGHRIGTAEIEDAMDDHHAVAESAVVGFPHDIKGEGIYAYITLMEDAEISENDLKKELRALVRAKIGGFATPEKIQISPGLPKTRSGKIMRRILRKVAADKHDDLGDISTLADPSVVAGIVEKHKELVAQGKV